MAYTYDFGILGQPIENARYDNYEPQKYHCLSVDFDAIDGLPIAKEIPCYWHKVDCLQTGLCSYGISLLPPSSLPSFLQAIKEKGCLISLQKKIEQAIAEQSYMIVYGL